MKRIIDYINANRIWKNPKEEISVRFDGAGNSMTVTCASMVQTITNYEDLDDLCFAIKQLWIQKYKKN